MATNKIVRLKAQVVKVTRTAGKPLAQMILTIPASASSDIPMEGEVNITMEPTQKSLNLRSL